MPEGLKYVRENASRDDIIELIRLPAVRVHQDPARTREICQIERKLFEDPVATSEGLHISLLCL